MQTNSCLAFERRRKSVRRTAGNVIERYRIDCHAPPRNRSFELAGPGVGLRLSREGSHDFFSFSEIIKTLVRPGMADLEKALAVYRFSHGYTHGFGIGFGSTEATRFLNCFGYSFCWGQADYQQLLYEAAGLRARAPHVKGHSTVEVFIDGQWRMLDAFMRLVAPSPELDGLATGKELKEHPEIWDHIREGAVVKSAKDYWSIHGPGGTYEPWQDSRAMTLNLRRGEALRFEYDRREAWCVAPAEPPDFCNGAWTWRPALDAQHLEKECDIAENVVVRRNALAAREPGEKARIEYRFKSPYPFSAGCFSAVTTGPASLRISLSNDSRKTWSLLQERAARRVACDMAAGLSRKTLSGADVSGVPENAAVYDFVLRLEWAGPLALRNPEFRLLVQAHNPSLPRLAEGVNRWMMLSTEKGAAVGHAWDEYPGFTVSNAAPLEGETIALRALVHNRGTSVARNVRVRFLQAGTDLVLGQAVIPRIAQKSSAMAQVAWQAKIQGDRPSQNSSRPSLYVRTVVRAEIGSDTPAGPWTGAAEAVIIVRPRPKPKFNDHLIWSSDARHLHDEKLVLRAALVHLPHDQKILYQRDVPLCAALTPFLGHPGRGGRQLAPPQRLENIPPSEFGVAEWTLSTHNLPKAFDVWIVAECDETVLPEHRRLLGKRRVTLAI